MKIYIFFIYTLLILCCLLILGWLFLIHPNIFNFGISFLTINLFELIFILLTLSIIYIYLKISNKLLTTLKTIVILLVLLPIVYLSIERGYRTVVVDEEATFSGVVRIKSSELTHWTRGKYRITMPLVGGLYSVTNKIEYSENIEVVRSILFAKGIHAIYGIIFILLIHLLLSKFYISPPDKFTYIFYFIVFLYLSLMLPSNLVALRINNSDAFSIFLSLLAIILGIIALTKYSIYFSFLSLIASSLAIQEKISAFPVFFLSVLIFSYCLHKKYKKIFYILFYPLFSIVVLYSTTIILSLIIGIFRDFNFPSINFVTLNNPLMAWNFAHQLTTYSIDEIYGTLSILYPKYLLLLYLITTTTILLFILVNNQVYRFKLINLKRIIITFSILIILIALWANINVDPYSHALLNPPDTQFDSSNQSKSIGNLYFYSDTYTLIGHLFKNISYYYLVFMRTIPSVIWIIIIGLNVYYILYKYKFNLKDKKDYYLDIGLICVLLFPLFYSMQSAWLTNRYYSFYTYYVVIYSYILVAKILIYNFSIKKQIIIVSSILILLFIEISPYIPTYGYFSPIYLNTKYIYNDTFIYGQKQSYTDYVLEHPESGNLILNYCEKYESCEHTRIFINYNGAWGDIEGDHLVRDKIKLYQGSSEHFPTNNELEGGYTENDFFIVTRLGASGHKDNPVPIYIKPIFIIKERELIVAKIYRGDSLSKYNFTY